jgi:hypothetical protein
MLLSKLAVLEAMPATLLPMKAGPPLSPGAIRPSSEPKPKPVLRTSNPRASLAVAPLSKSATSCLFEMAAQAGVSKKVFLQYCFDKKLRDDPHQ